MLQAEQAWLDLQKDTHLGPVVLRWGICPLKPHTDYFRELCESVLAQQISGKVAIALAKRFWDYLDGEVTPQKVAGLTVEDMRNLGISVRKAECILDLAKHCLDGKIPIEKFGEMDDQDIMTCLTKIKGIGSWTVTMFLIFALNRPRVIPALDFGIRKAIQNLFKLEDLPSQNEVYQYYKAWEPHETVASWYLWRSLENQGRA